MFKPALAQRSADAAKQIKELISTSTMQVDQGVKLVAETGNALERIMAQVAEINEVVGEKSPHIVFTDNPSAKRVYVGSAQDIDQT